MHEVQTRPTSRETLSASKRLPETTPTEDFVEYLRAYAREKPDVAALWCFGIGFVLGWKLKPW